MTFHIISIFPGMFESYLGDSILKRAQESGKIAVKFYNPRDFTTDKHNKVDDTPYGGGPGMVMMVNPIIRAYKKARGRSQKKKFLTIFFSPRGQDFDQQHVALFIQDYTDIIMICGRYEGIDERVKEIIQPLELSVGQAILTGGELPAMFVMDAISRFIPGVLGNHESPLHESENSGVTYTKPRSYIHKGATYHVPEVLLSGDHAAINQWRLKK